MPYGTVYGRRQPSAYRVIEALRKGPATFGEVLKRTGLSRRAAHIALRQLVAWYIVEQTAKRGPYNLRTDLLTGEDLRNLGDDRHIHTIIRALNDEGQRIAKIRGREKRQHAFALFLKANLSLMAQYKCLLLAHASNWKDNEAAGLLLDKASRTFLEPWMALINVTCSQNRDVGKQAIKEAGELFSELSSKYLHEYDSLWLRQRPQAFANEPKTPR